MATSTHLQSNHWVIGIGDPTILGWVTVLVYFAVALFCLKAATSAGLKQSDKTFWIFLTFFLIALGINKQLDLQSLLTQIGRNIAIEQGLYEYRRAIQAVFIIFIGLLGIICTTILLRTYRKADRAIKIAFAGCIILFTFILIRASSFHHIDLYINVKLVSATMNNVLELGGLVIIGVGSYLHVNVKNNK